METPSSRESDRANVSPIFEITSRLIVLKKKGLSTLLFLYLKYFCFKRIEAFSALLHKTNNVNRFSMIYFYLILTFDLFVFWIGQGQLSFQVARCLYNIWFKMSKRFRAKLKKTFRGLKKTKLPFLYDILKDHYSQLKTLVKELNLYLLQFKVKSDNKHSLLKGQ